MAVASAVAAARIAAAQGRHDEAIAALRDALAKEDRLEYDEPADWFVPVRHLLGAELLRGGKAAQAETVYREDLQRHPGKRLGVVRPCAVAAGATQDCATVGRGTAIHAGLDRRRYRADRFGLLKKPQVSSGPPGPTVSGS